MRLSTAKKILNKNGINWSNYFDLNFVLSNINQNEHIPIVSAINRVKLFITQGI